MPCQLSYLTIDGIARWRHDHPMRFEILGEIADIETLQQGPEFAKSTGCAKSTDPAAGASARASPASG